MNKRNKGKSKKPNNPQPPPGPKVVTPAEVLKPTDADGTTETKPDETRVPEINVEVIRSAVIETPQEDNTPEKPKRNRSKRNKNKNGNIAEIPVDEVKPSVEIKLSEKEIESNKPKENRINNVATDPILEKEVSQSVETPTTTSRKKNKNKNKNKNADNQQAALIDQPLEAEKEKKAKIDEDVKKQKDAELTKLNLQIKAEKDQIQDNSENAPSAASRKKKGKNKNKSESSNNADKPVQYTSDTSVEKSISPNTQDESTITIRGISENSEKNNEHTESIKQSDLKVKLNTLSPDSQKLVNLVTPDLEPITNLGFEIEESSDKPLSKSARKRAKKNQNKNQAINQATHVVEDLTKKNPIAQCKIENLNSKKDNNKLLSEKVNTVATNEPISSCPMNALKDGGKKEQKEKDFLEEIKQSLDRSLEELITIENEQIDKIGTDAESIQSDGKQNADNKLRGPDNIKEPEPADTIIVADNFQIVDTQNKPLKDISEQPTLESEETCSETKAVVSEPSIKEEVKKLQSEEIVSTKTEPEPQPREASKLSEISEIETKADPETFQIIEGETINSGTQKTKTESNSGQECTKKETEIIHNIPILQNLDSEKIEKTTNLVTTSTQNETELNKNDNISVSEVITETTSKPSEQIHQKQNKNKLKNNKPAQVSETSVPREASVPILKEEINKMAASSQKHEEIIVGSVKENEQKNRIVEKSKEIQNKSSKSKDKGKHNMTVNVAKTATVTSQALESVREKQIPETILIDSNINISKETTSKEAEPKNKPVVTLYEKLEETSKDELSDDLEIFPELIPLTVLEVQNENHTLDSIIITPEIVKDVPEEFSVPDELPYVQLLAPKHDKGKGQSKKGDKISQPPSPKPTEDIKQFTAENVDKDILKLVQAIDSADSKPVITKQDDIDAAFEMIAQGAIKKNVPKENTQPSTARPSNQKVPADKITTDKLLQEENTKGNRSKNLVGLPDIPVISNKEDYKKEKNKKGKNKSTDAITSAPINGGQKQKDGFASEGDDEEFIYKYSFRKVFMANACHICKASLKSHRLVCSYCNLVSYCGQKHKDEDWPHHQALCFAISTIVHLKGLKFVYADAKSIGGQDYRLLRMQTIVSCEKILKRKLSPCEQEILLYPRMCLDVACREWRSAVLKDCDVCGQISYCKDKPSHFLEEHKKWCDSYKLYYKLVAHQQHKGRIEPRLPTKVISDTTFLLPANTTDLVKELYEGKLDLDDIHYAALTQIATAPLTALYGYQQYHKKNPDLPKDDTSFTIHVVGAELQFEADMLSKWEVFFLHLRPATADLKVVFVGPELNPSKLPLDILSKIRLCKECRQAKRNLTFEFQDGLLYHNFAKSEKFSKPNLVCAFNPGLHRTTGYGGLDTWPDTIKVILALACPICVTSYTSYELPRDLARLQECWPQVHIQTEPQLNPYASVRPDRNFISDDEMPLIFKNYYFMVVTG